jgi:hypothetical protein
MSQPEILPNIDYYMDRPYRLNYRHHRNNNFKQFYKNLSKHKKFCLFLVFIFVIYLILDSDSLKYKKINKNNFEELGTNKFIF